MNGWNLFWHQFFGTHKVSKWTLEGNYKYYSIYDPEKNPVFFEKTYIGHCDECNEICTRKVRI